MVFPPLGPVLYLIFSQRNDRHLGNVDKESSMLPVKSKVASGNGPAAQKTGLFAFYLQCVTHFCARLQCSRPLPGYSLIPEGLHSFGNVQCCLVGEPAFSSSFTKIPGKETLL